MNIIFIFTCIVTLGFMQCSIPNNSDNSHRNYFSYENNFYTLKIPTDIHCEFAYSDNAIMCGNNSFVEYEDTIQNIIIFIIPTEENAISDLSIWNHDETEQRKNDELIKNIREERNSFGHLVTSYLSNDSISTISLEYYPEWRIDTNKYVKYVDCTRAIFLKDGYCLVRIRRQYDEYRPIEDYEWTMSFENMSHNIKIPFKHE